MPLFFRLAALTTLGIFALSGGANAQSNCTSDTITAAAACFNRQLDQANQDMQAKLQTDQNAVKDQSQFAALLAKSQETWLAYRSQTCDDLVKTYFQEGQLQAVAATSCKVSLTKERASDLQNLFQGLGGQQ